MAKICSIGKSIFKSIQLGVKDRKDTFSVIVFSPICFFRSSFDSSNTVHITSKSIEADEVNKVLQKHDMLALIFVQCG